MRIEELKKKSGYEFQCNMSEKFKDYGSYDEWGSAYVWLGEDIGVEYNFCIQGEDNYCAIYKMELNEETDYMETDTSTYIHYEIDFSNESWKEKLENAMCEALISFFGL